MEQRKHPRVHLPVLVELQHPSLGRGRTLQESRATGSERCIARDISEGGVFVHLDVPPPLRPGAKLRLTLLNTSSVEHQPTPTVDMLVKRVEEHGLGLAFANRTGLHLWQSVERIRDELAVGRDYFQVHQTALVINEKGQLLIVQQHGKWGYPGDYLIVGEDWQTALKDYVAQTFDLADLEVLRVLGADSSGAQDLPEAAVFRTFVLVAANSAGFSLDTKPMADGTRRYRNARWVDHKRDVEALTFASDALRRLAYQALDWTGNEPVREVP